MSDRAPIVHIPSGQSLNLVAAVGVEHEVMTK